MPTVSVIVPIYNTERFLNRCVDSILAQTFKDIEIILVNDGSKDNSK
ncbi:MAG: glycosyltransferase, partial [Muribaculaceae bacterium]